MISRTIGWTVLGLAALTPLSVQAEVKVVTTLPSYASIAEVVGGDRVEAHSISRGDEDAHFVKPKPSFALLLKDARCLCDHRSRPGALGADPGGQIRQSSDSRRPRTDLSVPVKASRCSTCRLSPIAPPATCTSTAIRTSSPAHSMPRSSPPISQRGLERVDPAGAEVYEANLAAFQLEIDQRMFGEKLVAALGGQVLDDLARQGRLIEFLESQTLDGQPLIEHLGGWLGTAVPFHDKKIVAYHKNLDLLHRALRARCRGLCRAQTGNPTLRPNTFTTWSRRSTPRGSRSCSPPIISAGRRSKPSPSAPGSPRFGFPWVLGSRASMITINWSICGSTPWPVPSGTEMRRTRWKC